MLDLALLRAFPKQNLWYADKLCLQAGVRPKAEFFNITFDPDDDDDASDNADAINKMIC